MLTNSRVESFEWHFPLPSCCLMWKWEPTESIFFNINVPHAACSSPSESCSSDGLYSHVVFLDILLQITIWPPPPAQLRIAQSKLILIGLFFRFFCFIADICICRCRFPVCFEAPYDLCMIPVPYVHHIGSLLWCTLRFFHWFLHELSFNLSCMKGQGVF